MASVRLHPRTIESVKERVDIVDVVGTSQSNISQHLAILREKGILSTRKAANKVYYKVSDVKTLKLIEMMREVFCSHQN